MPSFFNTVNYTYRLAHLRLKQSYYEVLDADNIYYVKFYLLWNQLEYYILSIYQVDGYWFLNCDSNHGVISSGDSDWYLSLVQKLFFLSKNDVLSLVGRRCHTDFLHAHVFILSECLFENYLLFHIFRFAYQLTEIK